MLMLLCFVVMICVYRNGCLQHQCQHCTPSILLRPRPPPHHCCPVRRSVRCPNRRRWLNVVGCGASSESVLCFVRIQFVAVRQNQIKMPQTCFVFARKIDDVVVLPCCRCVPTFWLVLGRIFPHELTIGCCFSSLNGVNCRRWPPRLWLHQQ